ncbi:MAG: response regulator [Gammaproteobacteria bacterium]|nr:response regulator [Gammaproteobacteria bacterium]
MYKSMKALVVDDTASTRQFVSRILQTELQFSKVVQSANARDALSRLAEEKSVDIIICDWEMPKISGLSFLSKIKEIEHFKSIPFIMATSRADKESIIKAIEAGVNDYLIKPFSGKSLEEKIDKLLSGSNKKNGEHFISSLIKQGDSEIHGTLMSITPEECHIITTESNESHDAALETTIFINFQKHSFYVKGTLINSSPVGTSTSTQLKYALSSMDANTTEKINRLLDAKKSKIHA